MFKIIKSKNALFVWVISKNYKQLQNSNVVMLFIQIVSSNGCNQVQTAQHVVLILSSGLKGFEFLYNFTCDF